jgi:hypothetical protein
LDVLEREHDNLRAALNWLIASRRFDLAQAMVSALEGLCFVRRHLNEGQQWLEAALGPANDTSAAGPQCPDRATTLALLAGVKEVLGDIAGARELALQAESEARHIGEPVRLFQVLWMSGELARTRGELDHATACVEEALELSSVESKIKRLGELNR